jgi:hypothetical protein
MGQNNNITLQEHISYTDIYHINPSTFPDTSAVKELKQALEKIEHSNTGQQLFRELRSSLEALPSDYREKAREKFISSYTNLGSDLGERLYEKYKKIIGDAPPNRVVIGPPGWVGSHFIPDFNIIIAEHDRQVNALATRCADEIPDGVTI